MLYMNQEITILVLSVIGDRNHDILARRLSDIIELVAQDPPGDKSLRFCMRTC